MFKNEQLEEHLKTSSTIRVNSAVIAEWNMNIATNILQTGNYRYRPNDKEDTRYNVISQSFSTDDLVNRFYTDATDADVVVDGGVDLQDVPTVFLSKKEKEKLLFSLEDCFGRFRPRSGINKLRYFEGGYSHFSNARMAQRPRYYMADRNDTFKYWTSYRTEDGIERGIANESINGINFIEDAAPYVVYKEPVPANRIVVKMQTNVGSVDLGPFVTSSQSLPDPFFGDENKTTPVRWSVQYLKNNTWIDAVEFDENSTRFDGSPVVGPDGYVEISYGLIPPTGFETSLNLITEYTSSGLLPSATELPNGIAYIVKENDNSIGTLHVVFGGHYEQYAPEYGWYLSDEAATSSTSYAKILSSPESFINPGSGLASFREFELIQGVRIVAESMNVFDSTFDLIEMSPRLVADISGKTTRLSVNKIASDLGVSGLPVGQLLASTGSLDLFDYDQAFFDENKNSIIHKYLSQNIQIKFYEIVIGVNGLDYFVPIKTMYSEGFPQISTTDRSVSINLRDLFFYFESITAPQILVQNVSLSYAVSLLLDAAGFSNYVFKRNNDEPESIIPFFFIPPDKSIAEILNELAVSTQTAMFFDELNNFVTMSRGFVLPSEEERPTDIILYGTKDFERSGEIKNLSTKKDLSNVISLSFQDNEVYNDGSVNYTVRSIQRSYGKIKQASLLDRDKTWVYKPALLWEVSGTENTKSINEEVGNQSEYVLSAIPLNSQLTSNLPQVENYRITNNTIDLGDGIYWIARYNGYFYANGEILRYDAVQYSIPGLSALETSLPDADGDNIWISSVQEYQKYFSKISFNGKMYPTGLVRIYSEPNYETIDGITRLSNGPVAKHGRGQFGTPVLDHSAGLSERWTSPEFLKGCKMKSVNLFEGYDEDVFNRPAGIEVTVARASTRTGIIENFLTRQFTEESDRNTPHPGTMQSSALVIKGNTSSTTEPPLDHVSYVFKKLEDRFVHFGTRMRIIGQVKNDDYAGQAPDGANTFFSIQGSYDDEPTTISGSSGGMAVLLNPLTNAGYYFEIAALSQAGIEDYSNDTDTPIYNMYFYKVGATEDGSETDRAIPKRLWGGLSNILVDDGKFTGQARMSGEENPTVYDLAVEYENINNIRRFYLYVNNVLISIVDDPDPFPVYNNMALFVRGNAKCMFENVYALTDNYSQNTTFSLETPANSAFGALQEINATESFQKYAISGMVQSTYLSGISSAEPPKYNIYFEEFGTIMREASYFNFRYDKAYPALLAQISPTFNRIKGYTVSGFVAGAYGAEFLIFNNTDTALSLDSTSGNYLRIQGVTFTQGSQNELTVDQYFERVSNFSDPQFVSDNAVRSPLISKQNYTDIKLARMTEGRKEFSIDAPYIQSQDEAESLMAWLVSKIMKKRKSLGADVFALPIMQLGDIVKIEYTNADGVNEVSDSESRFVVYNIDYTVDPSGPSMVAYLSEVPSSLGRVAASTTSGVIPATTGTAFELGRDLAGAPTSGGSGY